MAHTKKKMAYSKGKAQKVGGSKGMVGNIARKSETKMSKGYKKMKY